MTREEAFERIHDPRPAPLAPGEERSFELWLERDAELRALHEDQRALFAVMDAWQEDAAPLADFEARLRARIAAEPARPGWTRTLASWLSWPRAAAWAGCAAAAMLAVMVWTAPQEPANDAPPVVKAVLSSEDAEYVQELDRALDDMEMLIDFDALAPDRS
jgi:anti-sigma-K factor RskA